MYGWYNPTSPSFSHKKREVYELVKLPRMKFYHQEIKYMSYRKAILSEFWRWSLTNN